MGAPVIRRVDLDDDSVYLPFSEGSSAPFDLRDEGRSVELVSGSLAGSADVNLGIMRLGPGEHHIPHRHPAGDELYVFLSGRATLEIDGEVHPAVRGTIAFMPAGTPHGVHNNGDDPVDVLYALNAAEYEDVGLIYESD